MRAYLIQRAKFEYNDSRQGIDSVIYLDYMGAAEFEWGALPKSLAAIRKDINEYIYTDLIIRGKSITVFCKSSQFSDMEQYLNDLADGKMMLHEHSDFGSYVTPSEYDTRWIDKHGHNTDFWWDILNHVMFWKTNDEFKTRFETAINSNNN